jgi:3-oxoacyl-[acyl-carrier protein] reductase
MADRYQQLVNTPIGRIVTKQVGLPAPVRLERYEPGQPLVRGPVLLGAARGGRLSEPVEGVLREAGAELFAGIPGADETFKALVFDATGIKGAEQLHEAYAFFHPVIRRLRASGRVIVLGALPSDAADPWEAIAQRALEGLVRSIGKEVRRGVTAQLLYVAPDAEDQLASSLRFFISPKSAYVSGQVVRIGDAVSKAVPSSESGLTIDWERPLVGKVALVTGAARGIGEAIAGVLARDGADVVGLDVPAQASELDAVVRRIGGSPLTLDITDDDGPATIAAYLAEKHGGVDVVVHNAGVTRDRTLGRMSEDQWDLLMKINLIAPHKIDQELFGGGVVRDNGRIVLVSSISGIAGNAGQTNYATSKAGVIGMVEAFAPALAKRGATVNAVAPGFIETAMTAAVPITVREAGRRMNSMAQGGLPIDVAETIAWFANPMSAGVNGNVVRVCGQSLLGA